MASGFSMDALSRYTSPSGNRGASTDISVSPTFNAPVMLYWALAVEFTEEFTDTERSRAVIATVSVSASSSDTMERDAAKFVALASPPPRKSAVRPLPRFKVTSAWTVEDHPWSPPSPALNVIANSFKVKAEWNAMGASVITVTLTFGYTSPRTTRTSGFNPKGAPALSITELIVDATVVLLLPVGAPIRASTVTTPLLYSTLTLRSGIGKPTSASNITAFDGVMDAVNEPYVKFSWLNLIVPSTSRPMKLQLPCTTALKCVTLASPWPVALETDPVET